MLSKSLWNDGQEKWYRPEMPGQELVCRLIYEGKETIHT